MQRFRASGNYLKQWVVFSRLHVKLYGCLSLLTFLSTGLLRWLVENIVDMEWSTLSSSMWYSTKTLHGPSSCFQTCSELCSFSRCLSEEPYVRTSKMSEKCPEKLLGVRGRVDDVANMRFESFWQCLCRCPVNKNTVISAAELKHQVLPSCMFYPDITPSVNVADIFPLSWLAWPVQSCCVLRI